MNLLQRLAGQRLLLVATLPLTLGWLLWWSFHGPSTSEPGPPVDRLLGTWVFDGARQVILPPEQRRGIEAWSKVTVEIKAHELIIDDGRQRRSGPCRVVRFPPVFYEVHWEPIGGKPLVVSFGLVGNALNWSPTSAMPTVVPLKRRP